MRMFHENELWLAGPAIAPLANGIDAEVAGDPNVRWLQSTLNQLMNAGLGVDGVSGPATRAAVRNFQSKNGLVADGVAGPATVAALRAALTGNSNPARPSAQPVCTGLPVRQTLDRFAFGSHRLEPHHMPQIDGIAACLLASLETATPIPGLTIIGHTDPVGDEMANVALGQRRADAVTEAINASLRRQAPERSYSFVLAPTSAGERSTVPGDPALSRRVDILAPFAFPPPPRPGGKRRPKPKPQHASPLDPPRWAPILSRAMGPRAALRTGNAVRHLIDAEKPAHPMLAAYPAMIDAIKAAQGSHSFIYLLGWVCFDQFDMVTCDATTKLNALLTDAASKGVQVRAILWDQVDPIANAQNSKTIDRINKLPGGAAIMDNKTLSTGSHHQKMLVVGSAEHLVAFTGGIDVNPDRVLPNTIVCPTPPSPRPRSTGGEADDGGDDESSSGGGGKPLHDVHCRIEGPSAFDMLATFITRWDHHPDTRPIEARAPLRGRSARIPGAVPGPLSPGQSATAGTCSVVTARTFNPRRGSGLPRERDIKALLLAAIANARRFIYMEEQYLLNLEAAAALRAALPQIEHLTIVIGASDISDLPCVWTYRREFIDALTRGLAPELTAKVRVFQLTTPPLPAVPPACATKRKTFKPTFGAHTYVHAKCWVFDDELAVIGSANCNKRGWEHDSELNAFIFDDRRPSSPSMRSFAQQFRMDAWAEHLNVAPARVEDGVASAALWLRPGVRANVLPYCPNDDDDAALMPCSILKDSVVDPPAP